MKTGNLKVPARRGLGWELCKIRK